MAKRKTDALKVEAVGLGTFDRFTACEMNYNLTAPSEASFEIGDDDSWADFDDFVAMGTTYRVTLNGQPMMTGRIEARNVPITPDGAASVRFVVRTKLADANYASADPKTRVKDVSVKDFLLALYKPLGFTEDDFLFDADVSRNLITGVSKSSGRSPTDLEPIKEDAARVQPPESIFSAADRHLRRHGFMHWDAPDGKIVVGKPNDDQDPLYYFRLFKGSGAGANNLLDAEWNQDWSEIATILGVFGSGGKRDYTASKVRGFATDDDVIAAGFYRPVLIVAEGVRTKELAERAARRELSARSKQKDAWNFTIDGFSFWDGSRLTNYAFDTVADVVIDTVDGAVGAYFVHRVGMRRTPAEGDTTTISAIKKGIWVL